MKKSDIGKMLKRINVYYPNNKIVDFEETAIAWYLILQNEDERLVSENFARHVKTSVFPPTIADLLKVPEKKRKYMPGVEETRLMLLARPSGEQLATEEEKREGLAKAREILLKNGAKYE